MQLDSFNYYWHGERGRYHIQIDLGKEYNVTQISVYNRWHSGVDWRLKTSLN